MRTAPAQCAELSSFSSWTFKASSKFQKVSPISFSISMLTSFERQDRPSRTTQLGAPPVWGPNESQNRRESQVCGLSAVTGPPGGVCCWPSDEAIMSSSNTDAFCPAQGKQLGLIKKGNATIFAITSVALETFVANEGPQFQAGGAKAS